MILIIVRHAKSSWNNAALSDFNRPLAPRGERSTHLVGQWLAERSYPPKQVICSSALRTRQTWNGLQAHLPSPETISTTRLLYHADLTQIIGLMKKATDSPLLMIGHNPGIGQFAAEMLDRAPNQSEFWRYPTCAATICRFAASSWSEVQCGTGHFIDFIFPRDLE